MKFPNTPHKNQILIIILIFVCFLCSCSNLNIGKSHYNLGLAYGDKGLYDKAIEEYKEAIRIDPDYVKAHCNLGVAYSKKGLYDKAIEEFKKAIQINPNYAKAHYNLGDRIGDGLKIIS